MRRPIGAQLRAALAALGWDYEQIDRNAYHVAGMDFLAGDLAEYLLDGGSAAAYERDTTIIAPELLAGGTRVVCRLVPIGEFAGGSCGRPATHRSRSADHGGPWLNVCDAHAALHRELNAHDDRAYQLTVHELTFPPVPAEVTVTEADLGPTTRIRFADVAEGDTIIDSETGYPATVTVIRPNGPFWRVVGARCTVTGFPVYESGQYDDHLDVPAPAVEPAPAAS